MCTYFTYICILISNHFCATAQEKLYADVQPKFEATHPKFDENAKPPYPDDVQALIDAANSARDAHRAAETKANELRSKLESIEGKLNMDYGESREWAETHGKCYENKNGE